MDQEAFACLAWPSTALITAPHPWGIYRGLYRNQEKRFTVRNVLSAFKLCGLMHLQKVENVANKTYFSSLGGFNKLLQL